MRKYNLKFNSLVKYAPKVVAAMDDRVYWYEDSLDPCLVTNYTISSLNKDIDILRIQALP